MDAAHGSFMDPIRMLLATRHGSRQGQQSIGEHITATPVTGGTTLFFNEALTKR
jgi:hypothetical protein